jgi:hypothetical protein
MATTTNYAWETPDDTDLVKDGAAAIRTLGSSIDTTTKALNPSTTLGDIEYRSSTANTNTRLGIGTTGQILTVSGGVPAWAAAASPSSLNYQLLNTGGTALTGAQNITISGITSKALLIEVVDASSTLAASYMRIKLNNEDNCSTVIWNALDTTLRQAVTDNSIPFGQTGNAQADKVSGVLSVYSADAAGKKPLNFTGAASGTGRYTYWGSGMYDGSAVTSVVFNSSDGNFDGGTIYVYGAA